MSKTFLEQYKAARRAATPLMAINTADPAATIAKIVASTPVAKEDDPDGVAFIQWNVIDGWQPLNDHGAEAVGAACKGEPPRDVTSDPVEQLILAQTALPEYGVLFVHNGHLFLEPTFDRRISFIQALWNLRDELESKTATVVLLGPSFTLPDELSQDVLVLDEPLPDAEQLKTSIRRLANANDLEKVVTEEMLEKGTDALRGLAHFPAKQATAMCLTRDGLDVENLWERKVQLIEQTEGLTVWRDGMKFSDLGGIEEIKTRARRIINGRNPFRVVVWIDEGEKALAGSGAIGDTSGTSQDQLSVLLSEIQDKSYNGMLLVGVPGGAKSAFAKALGNEAGVLTVKCDLGSFKGSLVGESERKIRNAMKVIESIGGYGGAFFVMTSNDIRIIKPELKRRFRKGIWLFDLPTKEERELIWNIYLNKYPDVVASDRAKVKDEDWTGAEIETCVITAYEERVTLHEAAKGIIPVAISGKEDIERLRSEASGRYNSASYPGAYTQQAATRIRPTTERKLNLN